MKEHVERILLEVKQAEETSSFKPAKQVQHLKNALYNAVRFMEESASRIESLEQSLQSEKVANEILLDDVIERIQRLEQTPC